MSNNVDITIAADDKSAQQALDQLQGKLDKTERKLEKMRHVSRQATDQTTRGFDSGGQAVARMGAKITSVLAGLMSFRQLIQAVGDEWQETARKQEAARSATLAPAQALRMAKFNFTADPTMGNQDFEQAVKDLAKETNAPVANVATALTDALSAKGSATNQQVFDAVRQALQIDPANPEFAATLAGGFLDIAKFSGTKDISQIPGLLLQTQAASRVTDPGKVGSNLLPGVAGLVMRGDTPEQAAELVAALTQLGIEKKGETTSTAAISLAGQMMDFVPQRATKGKFKGQLTGKDPRGEFAIPDEQFAQFDAAKSPTARLQVLQQSPELQRAFLGASSFEKKIEEPIRQMIQGTDKALAELQNAQRTIEGIGPNQTRVFQEKLAFAGAGDLQENLTADQAMKSRTESHLLGDTASQRFAFARKSVENVLENIDRPGWDTPQNTVLKNTLEFAFKNFAAKRAEGEVVGPPEFAAARALELMSRKGRFFGESGMSAEDQKFLDEEIRKLREIGEKRGNLFPDQFASEKEKNFWETRRAAGTPSRFTGPVQSPASDPQMEENNRLLQELVNQGSAPAAPRQTTRPTSRLSRGAN